MATSHSDSEVTRLAAKNQALSEELAQCQADKEFVWSLWKRLQVANPDISQAISIVVQREKEKAEIKDRKILEILHSKDDRIAQLEQLLSEQDKRLEEVSERFRDSGDLKEELATLHEQLKETQESTEEKIKERTDELHGILGEKDAALQEMAREKEELKRQVDELQSTVEESHTQLQRMQDLNSQYETKVQELQIGLEDVVKKAKLASLELDDKTEGLQRAKTKLQGLTVELKNSGQDLHRRRQEYEALKVEHDQAIHQASQQAQLIHQLQALQADTHKVLKNQENAHSLESTSFQKMYHELRIRFEKLVNSERELRQRLAVTESHLTAKQPMRSVSLQVNLDKISSGQRSRSRTRSKSGEVRSTEQHEELTKYTETVTRVSSEISARHDEEGTPDRATSTPVKDTALRRARSLSPSGGHHAASSRQDGAWSHGRISEFLDASKREERGRGRGARKEEDLRKLLRLKNQEVEALRKAHSRRLERLRTVQSAYDLLKEQIKTYEQHESEKGKEKKKVPRSESKELRREDSDGVWNDLAYYKTQTANLMQEKMNIEEEIDRLRVQAAVDSSTIEDLTRCLDEERNGLESQLARLQAANKREEREKARAEDLFEKNKKLQKSLQSLQSKLTEWTEERDQLERHLRSMRADLVRAKTVTAHKEVEHQALLEEITKLKLKMKKLSRSMKQDRKMERAPSQQENRDVDDHDDGGGVHIILHDEDDDERNVSAEGDLDDDDHDDYQNIYHSTPTKVTTRRSRSLSPAKSSPGPDSNSRRSRPRSSPYRHSTLSPQSRSSSPGNKSHRMSRSRSIGTSSPSKRELVSVLHHLDRMAQAYQGTPPVYRTLLMSVATQTERVVYAESGMMTESDGSESGSLPSLDGAVFPGIQPLLSPIFRRRDTATSPIKSLSFSSQTTSKKSAKTKGMSPGPGGVNALKRRLGALQQQVASLQEQRVVLQKAAVEHKETRDSIQADLNLANARHHNTKITIQRMTHEVEELKKQKDLLRAENEDLAKQTTEKHSDAAWKSAEARLKYQASEIVRQGSAIKAMKSEKEGLNEVMKTLESKIQHLERDVSQKRSLIDDLRARAKSANSNDKMHAETVDMLEAKILGLTEALDKRKVEIDSLRKRVAVVTKEKHHYEQQAFDLQNELDKKAAVLKDTLFKLSESESTFSELEATASQQLQMLASQSETALDAAHVKIKQLQSRIRDLENFIQDLAAEISSQAQIALDQALEKQSKTNTSTPGLDQEKDQSMVRAQSIASSILNLSTKDLEQFMEVERDQEQTEKASQRDSRKAEDDRWRKRFEVALNSKKFQRKQLKDLMMERLHDRDEALSLARESR